MEVHGSVLGAHTQGETHMQNDTSLAGRPKNTTLRAAPLCGFLYMSLSLGTGSCLY